ncbi:DUF2459 domain-containing protein [Magnetofaba australis]|uniref:DUF2459 domain-containing protein n=1 Tax=Magnetofaba australis TaxID=1472297 RepID=UPI001301AE99|nr:DUF2459 domain-containing protein [Magnetofaba australis]
MGHGWHTGVVVDLARVGHDQLAAAQDFANFRYLEIGWGDEGFYRAPNNDITVGLAARAIFLPTPSVLHLVGINAPPQRAFSASDVRRVPLSKAGFDALLAFIDGMFDKDEAGELRYLGPGLYGYARFYRAHGSYTFFRTCNTWTQQALKAAQLPIHDYWGATSESVLEQVDALPQPIQLRP